MSETKARWVVEDDHRLLYPARCRIAKPALAALVDDEFQAPQSENPTLGEGMNEVDSPRRVGQEAQSDEHEGSAWSVDATDDVKIPFGPSFQPVQLVPSVPLSDRFLADPSTGCRSKSDGRDGKYRGMVYPGSCPHSRGKTLLSTPCLLMDGGTEYKDIRRCIEGRNYEM